jgi:hypothetical protein
MNLELFKGQSILIKSLKELFEAHLPTIIDELNPTFTDGITIAHPAQIVPYIPILSILSGGMPIVGIGEMPANFDDDLQFSLVGHHKIAVMVVLQNSDHESLTEELRRYTQAIQLTIQQDRERPLHNETPYLSGKGGSWYTKFLATEPGPLLGEVSPLNEGEPPSSFTSWTGIALEMTREEI